MPDGYRVLSFRSGLFAQCIGIVTDGFGHDADSHCIRIKCFRTCSDSGILIPERLRSKSDRRRVLRFLAWFHNGVVLHRRVVVIRNTDVRRGSVRCLFTDIGASSDRRAIPCGAVCRCFRSEYGRMIAFCFCSHTDCESDIARRFGFAPVSGGVIGPRFRLYANRQRIGSFRLGSKCYGDSGRCLCFCTLSDGYAPSAGRFRISANSYICIPGRLCLMTCCKTKSTGCRGFRPDSDIIRFPGFCFLTDRDRIFTCRAVILPVRSVGGVFIIGVHGEIVNRAFVYFGIQCFQLRDIDRVGVFRTGCQSGQLTGVFLFRIAYRNRALRRFPYFGWVVTR